jgi:hypothetical protein
MKGQQQKLQGNVYLYPEWGTQCVHVLPGMDVGNAMHYINNTCIARSADIYSSCSEDQVNAQVLANNTYYVPGGETQQKIVGFSCAGGNWTAWQATGQDAGSTIAGATPLVETMVGWGKELLGF